MANQEAEQGLARKIAEELKDRANEVQVAGWATMFTPIITRHLATQEAERAERDAEVLYKLNLLVHSINSMRVVGIDLDERDHAAALLDEVLALLTKEAG